MIPALTLARLSADAYTSPASVERGAIHVTYSMIGAVTVAAFRGSGNLADWLVDLDDSPHVTG